MNKTNYKFRTGMVGCIVLFSVHTAEAQNSLDQLALVSDGNKFWFISPNGTSPFEGKAGIAGAFSEGLAFVDYTYINGQGKTVIKKDSLHLTGGHGEFHNGLAVFYNAHTLLRDIPSTGKEVPLPANTPLKENKFGYINTKGDITIPPAFDWAGDFNNGMALVNTGCTLNSLRLPTGGKFGFINATGEIIIPAIYDDACSFSEGLAAASKDGKWGFIDPAGQTVIEFKFDAVSSFSEGLARFKSGGKFGFMNLKGEIIIPPTYDLAGNFHEGLAAVNTGGSERKNDANSVIREGGKWGYINKEGKMVIPLQFKHAQNFSGGFAAVASEKDLYGYIDTAGHNVIPLKYEQADNFSCGYAAVRQNKKWGYIDKKGKWVVLPQFEIAGNFREVKN